jgi:hypothetical protein
MVLMRWERAWKLAVGNRSGEPTRWRWLAFDLGDSPACDRCLPRSFPEPPVVRRPTLLRGRYLGRFRLVHLPLLALVALSRLQSSELTVDILNHI